MGSWAFLVPFLCPPFHSTPLPLGHYRQLFISAELTVEDAQQFVHVALRDTGIGIDPTEHDHVFLPFGRSENHKALQQPGYGLGLTIAKGIIDAHGGRMWIESELDKGSTLHFTLPVA